MRTTSSGLVCLRAGAEADAARRRLGAVLAKLDPASGKLGDETGKHAKKSRAGSDK
jgi:hypothetical protein